MRIAVVSSLVSLALVVGTAPAFAVDLLPITVPVTATVAANLSFSAEIRELVPNTATPDPSDTLIGPVVTNMAFGTLASNGNFDPDGAGPLPPQLRALNSTKAFQVFFGVNAQGRPFQVKQTAGPLQSGPNQLTNNAFVVTPLAGVGGDPTQPFPANLVKGAKTSAVGTGIVLFSSTGGPSATMAATYGITDNSGLPTPNIIAPDAPTGTYTTTITYTATIT